MRPLIVGGDGQIGAVLAAALHRQGRTPVATTRHTDRVSADRPFLDLSDDRAAWQLPADIDVAYLCAAMTGLQACEDDPEGTRAINVDAIVALADRLHGAGARVIFLSTNQVFNGTLAHPEPDTPTAPLSAYGRQKADAERGILALGDGAAVVRLTKVFAAAPPLFGGWLETLGNSARIEPFSDMKMAPLMMDDVCAVLCRMGAAGATGIYQLSAAEDIAYADAARRLCELIGADPALVHPVRAADRGFPAFLRPAHTCLDTARAGAEFDWTAPDALDVVDGIFADLLAERRA